MYSDSFKNNLIYKGDQYKYQYKWDGTGRDGYISSNNGGFTIHHAPATQIKPGTTYTASSCHNMHNLGCR